MSIADNLSQIRQRLEQACQRVERSSSSVRLVAVSKTFPSDIVSEAAKAGQTLFGENRVQEAGAKIEALRGQGLQWHLIGSLQSNKARKAVELFDVIESIDSLELARRVNDLAGQVGKSMPLLVQVRLGDEATKHGVDPANLDSLLCRLFELPNLQVQGLMTIPPFVGPVKVRPYFRQLRELRDGWNDAHPEQLLKELSMGMSADFESAIEEGATLVRIGTALFGERQA